MSKTTRSFGTHEDSAVFWDVINDTAKISDVHEPKKFPLSCLALTVATDASGTKSLIFQKFTSYSREQYDMAREKFKDFTLTTPAVTFDEEKMRKAGFVEETFLPADVVAQLIPASPAVNK
jgi:hypothetical protein